MPVYLPENNPVTYLAEKDFGYVYPNGLDLKPGSPLHERIKVECMSLAQQSRSVMQQRHSAWDLMSHKLTAFIPKSTADALQSAGDSQAPVDIVVPVAYANYELTLSYLMGQLLVDPILKYDATEPADRVGAGLMELVMSFQCRRSRAFLEFYTALQDCLRFGLGVVHVRWEVLMGQRTHMRDKLKPSNVLPGEFYIDKPAGFVEEYKAYEGNAYEAIDPYLYFPDTSVPLYKPQSGEFVSWLSPGNNRSRLQELEATSNGYMFNVKYLQYVDVRSTLHSTTGRTLAVNSIDVNTQGAAGTRRPVDILWMYRDIIPAEHGLGSSERLEKWVFGIANDAIVICAQPTNLDHKRCPVVVMAPEADGHTILPIGRMELSHGMQNIVDGEFNMHAKAAWKMLQGNLVIDPGLLNLETLKDGSVLKYLFLKRSAWGLGKIDQAVMQLKTEDPTVNNIRDIGVINQLMSQTLGTAESSGLRRQGRDRVTAQEVQDDRGGSSSRLNKVVAIIYAQAFMDLADISASHTRQLMEEETYVKVTGRYRNDLIRELGLKGSEPGISVTPQMLDTDWDVTSSDVFTSTASASDWQQMYGMLLQNPESARDIDLTRVFLHIARLLGERNAHNFLREPNVQVQPTAQVMDAAANGSLVPANGVTNEHAGIY